jgi:hypothetical protein
VVVGMSRHTDLIDAVNDAKTEYEHTWSDGFLAGWRAGQAEAGHRWSFVEADTHSMARFGERPICCGVLLGWKPEPVAAQNDEPELSAADRALADSFAGPAFDVKGERQ